MSSTNEESSQDDSGSVHDVSSVRKVIDGKALESAQLPQPTHNKPLLHSGIQTIISTQARAIPGHRWHCLNALRGAKSAPLPGALARSSSFFFKAL